MNSTALGAEKENINFISEAHEKFYYEKIQKVREADVYHKALCYCIGMNEDTRRNVDRIYNFKTGCVKPECLHEGWQTSGSAKVVRMAFNLYCNGTPSVDDEQDTEEQVDECRRYSVEDLFCCCYAPYFWQLYPNADVKITGFEKTDYPNDFFDVAIGNVPFGQYKVADRAYDKHNFLIHDYFFAKALDKVRPGGVVAFVTSKGTMDKKSPEVRKYLAQRAELLGAIRLPNTAFKENAGTEVTSDILFLKKRDRVIDIEPDWVHLCENEDGIAMNQYFADHPEMIMGKMEMVSGQFGMEATCTPDTTISLSKQLEKAISHIEGSIDEVEFDELDDELAREAIPADPGVKNYSYTIVDERVYYRENSIMKPVDVSETMEQRMKGMVQIRDCTQELIDYQLNEYPEDMIKSKQAELNELYDAFSKKYGLINS